MSNNKTIEWTNNLGLTEQDYYNFKKILEYFVAHLEHVVNSETGKRKENLSDKLKDLLNGRDFVVSGDYNTKRLQNIISEWSLFPMGRISITIGGNPKGDYATKRSYLQWKDTGLNINAEWDGEKKKIVLLKASCYTDEKSECPGFKVEDLSLFKADTDESRQKIKDFLDKYAQSKVDLSLNEIIAILEKNKNLILTGAPGTGKTFLAEQMANKLTNDSSKWTKVQFHPSYDYTDFVEGIRPKKEGNTIGFEYKQGTFMEFCAKAALDNESSSKWVFIIDEINRGELNKIFGELFSCIEAGYRGVTHSIATQYQNIASDKISIDGKINDNPFKDGFYVPEKVYIIGTMNDIDRSVESIDFALRRRFCWREIGWEYSLYGMTEKIDISCRAKVIQHLSDLNEKIANTEGLGDSFCLGGAYIKDIQAKSEDDLPHALRNVWHDKISLVIKEYLRGQVENLDGAVSEFGEVFLSTKKE